MFYGSVVFIGSHTDLQKVNAMIDDGVILDDILEVTGPIDVDLDGDGILYNVEFSNDQWIDIQSLHNSLGEQLNVDVIHALTDGSTFIEVLSTNCDYDDYEDTDADKLEDIAKMYNLTFGKTSETDGVLEDEVIDEDDEDDEYSDESWD